jgi:perosamine synthetase
MKKIPYGRHHITPGDHEAVRQILDSGWLTQGPAVERFEAAICEAVGCRHAVVLSSGTAALHAAYRALGVGPGDRVVTSPISFVASSNGALYLGAEPAFADVDPATALIDTRSLAGVLEQAPARVVTPVHFAGQPADLEEIARIAEGAGALVLEDAAHALGGRWQDSRGSEHRIGDCSHSSAAIFSFHPVKHVATGEGGAVTTGDETIARRVRRFRSHGITGDPAELIGEPAPWYYEMQDLGFNYRMSDLQAGLGTSQIRRLEENVTARAERAARYDAVFDDWDLLQPLRQRTGCFSARHLYVVRLESDRLRGGRRGVLEGLRARHIWAHVHYIPIYRHPYYRQRWPVDEAGFPGAERYYHQALTLPLYPDLTDQDQQRVIEALAEELEERRV